MLVLRLFAVLMHLLHFRLGDIPLRSNEVQTVVQTRQSFLTAHRGTDLDDLPNA